MSTFSVRSTLTRWFLILGMVVFIAPFSGCDQPLNLPSKNISSGVSRQRLMIDMGTTIRKTPPATNTVAPQQMYSAFMTQYELGPDPRWVQALQILIEINMRWNQQAAPSYSLGAVTFDDKTVFLPLQKDGRVILNLELPTYTDFPEGLAMLQKAVAAMGWQYTGVKTEGRGDDLEARLITWRDRFYSMDARGIIRALVNLEEVRGTSVAATVNAKLWATASVGYTMLGFSLAPDVLDYSDTCYLYALAYLAMGKQFEPELSTIREESFLAMGLGYKAHARALLEKQTFATDDQYSSIMIAYLMGDLVGLRKVHEKNPVSLSYCLLGRLYRYMELWKEASDLAEQFLKAEPRSYASMIATINDGDLKLGHVLTVVYPLDILARLKKNVTGDEPEDNSAWVERARAIYGKESDSDFSFQQFDKLLEKWTPWGSNINTGLIIDSTRIKDVYRALYSDAVYSRFNFLLERWSVPEMASTFVKSLAKSDMNHPLVVNMRMAVADELVDRASVDELAVRVIQHPQTTAMMVVNALYKLSSYFDKIRYAPQVFRKVTGKPQHILQAGYVFAAIWHLDGAEKMFKLSVLRDPFEFEGYRQLASKQGDAMVIEEALSKYSYNYKVMKSAGDYYARQSDPKLLEKALDCYNQAAAIVPDKQTLAIYKAGVLRDLKRYEEAISILKEWLVKHAGNDMTTLSYKQALAVNYLRMKDPKTALEVLTPEVVASYKADVMLTAAWAYDALGDEAQAEEVFEKVVARYPTDDGTLYERIAYLWRHQRDQEAVDLIAKARPRHGQKDYHWYFGTVRRNLLQASKERVLKIVDALVSSGAADYEIAGLAAQCFKNDPRLEYEIMSKMPLTVPMEMLEKFSQMYKILRDGNSEESANRFIDQNIPPQMTGPLTMVLYKEGLFELMLRKLQNVDICAPYQEFCWLEKVLAWEALDRRPVELGNEINRHYKITSTDYYNILGRFLLGQIKLDEVLASITTEKQRCEFAYYIGLSKRLAMQYEEATNWYLICLETQLANNGEMHWAMDELFWWAHAGTHKRHRLMRDDVAGYWQRQMAEPRYSD